MNSAPRVDLSQYYFQVSLKLYPKDGTAPGQPLPTSTMARGVLFLMLNQVDPSLVSHLHAPNAIRPYAIQRDVEWAEAIPSTRVSTSRKPRRKFRSVTFTINLFREDILRAFQKYLLQLQDLAIPLGEHTYLAGEVGISRKSFLDLFPPLGAGQQSNGVESHDQVSLDSHLPQSYYVQFCTPTYFGTTRSSFPLRFPTPEAVAGNLLRLWNEFHVGTGEIEEQPFIDWVNRGVVVTSYALRTKPWSVGKSKPVAGATGWATYTIREANPPYEKWLHALLRLGEVTNVGRSRTAGAGQIRIRPQASEPSFSPVGPQLASGPDT